MPELIAEECVTSYGAGPRRWADEDLEHGGVVDSGRRQRIAGDALMVLDVGSLGRRGNEAAGTATAVAATAATDSGPIGDDGMRHDSSASTWVSPIRVWIARNCCSVRTGIHHRIRKISLNVRRITPLSVGQRARAASRSSCIRKYCRASTY